VKKTIALFTLIALAILLSGCAGGIQGDEAKAHINLLLEAIEVRDYEAAALLLHPERPTDLKKYFEKLENETGLDFSSIQIERYTGFTSSLYDSRVNGSAYSLSMKGLVNGKPIHMKIEIVRNDRGYGIYNLDITAE